MFFIVALLILAFSFTAIFGVSYYTGDNQNTVLKGIGDIRWGIDIRGGVEATFKPADNYDATDEQLESAKSIIELRMISQGITDYELYADKGNDRIIVTDLEFNMVKYFDKFTYNGEELTLKKPEGVFVEQLALGGDRAQIRALSAHHALDMARRYLTHQMTEGE